MDPLSVSQDRLMVWVRDVDYYHSTAQFTNFQFSLLCNTPARRQLVDVITNALTDRRRQLHEKDGTTKECSLLESMSYLQRENASRYVEIDKLAKRIKERHMKLRKIDYATRELEWKRMLLRRIRERNRNVSLKYKQLGKTVEESCNEKSEDSIADLEEWLCLQSKEIAHGNDSLIKAPELCSRSGGDAFFQLLRRKQDSLFDLSMSSLSHFTDVRDLKSDNLLDSSWVIHLARKKIDCVVVDSLKLLMLGQRLRVSSNVKAQPTFSEVENIAENLFQSTKSDVDNLFITSCDELERVRARVVTARTKNVKEREYVRGIREQHIDSLEAWKKEMDATKGLVGDLATRVRTENLQWQKLVRRRALVTNRHGECLLETPLVRLRYQHPAGLACDSLQHGVEKKRVIDTNIPKQLMRAMHQELHALVLGMKDREDIDLETRRGKILQRQLKNLLERLLQSKNKIERVGEISKICKDGRFDEMVPTTHTANGMTFPEWMYQFSLRGNTSVGVTLSGAGDFTVSTICPTD